MERIACHGERRHLGVADIDAFFIGPSVERALDFQTCLRGRRLDQFDQCQSALNFHPLPAYNFDPHIVAGFPAPGPELWSLRATAEGDGAGRRLSAVLEAPAVVAGFDDVAVMGEPVEERRGHFRIGEDRGPFGEGEVCRHNDRGALVKAADQVEQQLAT